MLTIRAQGLPAHLSQLVRHRGDIGGAVVVGGQEGADNGHNNQDRQNRNAQDSHLIGEEPAHHILPVRQLGLFDVLCLDLVGTYMGI